MVIGKVNKFLEERRQKKASKIVEEGMLESYRETEEIKKAELLKKEADRLVHLKQYKAALEEYNNALGMYPYKPSDNLFQQSAQFLFTVHYNIGTSYLFLHDFKQSLDYFDKALAIQNVDDEIKVRAIIAKGNAYYAAKKFIEKTKEKHHKQITDETDFVNEEKIASEMRRIDDKENLIKKAHDCFVQASEFDRNNADLWYQKGHMEFLLGKVKDAISSFDTVLEIKENYDNKEGIEVFDEIKREKGLQILEKQERAYKTKTGHFVKNKAEMLIANFLFDNNLLFQYNTAMTWSDLDLQANFYIPQLELHIEHFKHNREEDQVKLEEYKKNNKRVIHTVLEDEVNMEETLKVKMKPFISL